VCLEEICLPEAATMSEINVQILFFSRLKTRISKKRDSQPSQTLIHADRPVIRHTECLHKGETRIFFSKLNTLSTVS
jgi:hypothetical protein